MSFPEVSEARFSSGFRPVFVSFRAMLTWGLSDMRTQLWEQTVVMRKEFWYGISRFRSSTSGFATKTVHSCMLRVCLCVKFVRVPSCCCHAIAQTASLCPGAHAQKASSCACAG